MVISVRLLIIMHILMKITQSNNMYQTRFLYQTTNQGPIIMFWVIFYAKLCGHSKLNYTF